MGRWQETTARSGRPQGSSPKAAAKPASPKKPKDPSVVEMLQFIKLYHLVPAQVTLPVAPHIAHTALLGIEVTLKIYGVCYYGGDGNGCYQDCTISPCFESCASCAAPAVLFWHTLNDLLQQIEDMVLTAGPEGCVRPPHRQPI